MTKRVAVVGAGTIGASWAAIFLARGLQVAAYDPSPNGEAFARKFIDNAWPTLQTLNWVVPGADRKNFSFHRDVAACVKDAEFIQESGPEREDVKLALFKEIDAAAPAGTVIASSSSGFMVSSMQRAVTRPERCVIGHPFNPPHLIPLVEVVGSGRTSPQAIETAMAFYASIGKKPIRLNKEVLGHVANRLQAALWREACHLVAEGVVSVADADAAIAYGPGLRWALMGPHLTFHLAGGEGGMKHFMDHIAGPMESWIQDLGKETRFTPEVKAMITEGVTEEAAGRSVAEIARWRDRKLIDILKVSEAP
jgi:3-hydroxyacyl-CoA dehydrogenase